MTDLRPGQEFAGHRIEAELGRGGMGVVYLGRHLALDRLRALKVLAGELGRDRVLVERFRREARLAAAIEHPNVVTIHHAGEEGGRLYLAMQYVQGSDLHTALAAGPMNAARVAAVIADAGAALDAAHASGLIHRDVKPANVLLGSVDGAERVYLTDFGISRLTAPLQPDATTAPDHGPLTSTGTVLGTTDYISPEQIDGGVLGPGADAYSLACVAFHALTGKPPFRRDTVIAALMAHAKAERPSAAALNPALTPAVDQVLAAGMAIDPAGRPPSAGAFADQLAAALGGGSPGPPPVPTAPTRATPSVARAGRDRLLIGGLAAVAVVAAILVGVLVLGGSDGQQPPPAAAPEDDGRPLAGFDKVDPVAMIEVGAEPGAVAVGDTRVWATSRSAGAVYRIDPTTDDLDGEPILVPGASAVAVGFGSIWVAGTEGVTRLDPGEGGRVVIPGEFVEIEDLTVDKDYVWVTDSGVPGREEAGDGRLVRIDPATDQISGEAPVGLDPRAVASDGEFVWVANVEDGTVDKVGRGGGVAPQTTIKLGPGARPTNIAAGEGGIWLTDFTGEELLQIDPAENQLVGDPVGVGPRPRGVAVGSSSVWVASGGANRVIEVNPRTLEVRGPLRRVGDDPAAIAVGAGGVWTADSGEDTVTRSEP